MLCALVLAGCSPASGELGEPSLDEQIQLVLAGKSDAIQIEQRSVTDDDLAKIADLKSLRILLLDNPASRITAEGLKHLASLPKLEHLRVRGPGIDNPALAWISHIKSLRILNLPQAEFNDHGLAQLRDLPELIQLRFGSPNVPDVGMEILPELPALERLHLIDVPITGKGLKALARIENLESLYIDGGSFTDADVDALFQARPNLHVHFNQNHHDRDPQKHAH